MGINPQVSEKISTLWEGASNALKVSFGLKEDLSK